MRVVINIIIIIIIISACTHTVYIWHSVTDGHLVLDRKDGMPQTDQDRIMRKKPWPASQELYHLYVLFCGCNSAATLCECAWAGLSLSFSLSLSLSV